MRKSQTVLGAPCLSFDIVPDTLGDSRETFPLTCYCVSGTQSEHGHLNHVIVMKMENLHQTSKAKNESDENKEDSDEEQDEDGEEDEDEKPELETALIKHSGSVNRIRVSTPC